MAEQPDWQPISQLPLIGSMIDGMLQDAEENYQTLLQAAPKPHVLDDYTVGRVFEVFGSQKDDLWLFEEQLARWKMDKLSVAPHEVEHWLPGNPSYSRKSSKRIGCRLYWLCMNGFPKRRIIIRAFCIWHLGFWF